MDDDTRLTIEKEMDYFIDNPDELLIPIEVIGQEPTDDNMICYVSGFLYARALAVHIAKGKATEGEKFIEEIREWNELIRRRIGELQNAFMR